MTPLNRSHRLRLVRASTIVAGALALSVATSGAASARELKTDDQRDVPIISPHPPSDPDLLQLKLRTTAGYNILVKG